MGRVYRLEEARNRHGKLLRRRVSFTRRELNQLLSLYSRRVMSGEWRDYAIDLGGGIAVFSIFRHSHERPIFSICKRATAPERQGDPSHGIEFTVSSGGHRLTREDTLGEALKIFDRHLQVVRAGPF